MSKKPNYCNNCGAEYVKRNTFHTACGYKCASEIAKKAKDKRFKKQCAKERSEFKNQDASHQKKLAERAFNRFIRLRDQDKPCISCGKSLVGDIDAGHYYSVGARSELRYHEDNVHGQCRKCNRFLSGNIRGYTEGLINRIGLDRFDALKSVVTMPVKLSASDYGKIKERYLEKCREIIKSRVIDP